MALQRRVSQLECSRQQEVVIVERSKVRGLHVLQSVVERCGDSGFAPGDQEHAVIVGQVCGEAGFVGRAVQDDDRAHYNVLLA